MAFLATLLCCLLLAVFLISRLALSSYERSSATSLRGFDGRRESQDGLTVETGRDTIVVASFLQSLDDVDSLCVLVYSMIASKSCEHRAATVVYRLAVSRASWSDERWDGARLRLASAGWTSFELALSNEFVRGAALRSNFLCEDSYAKMFRSSSRLECDTTQVLFLDAHTFVPWGQEGLRFANLCAFIGTASEGDLVASQFEHAAVGGIHAVVATCGGETLPFYEDPQSPIASAVEDLGRIRWMIISPLRGLTSETALKMQVKCLARLSAKHRMNRELVPVLEALPNFFRAVKQCDDAHSIVRQVDYFIPLVIFDEMRMMMEVITGSRGAKYIESYANVSHCGVERNWFVATFTKLAFATYEKQALEQQFLVLRDGVEVLLFHYGQVHLHLLPNKNITTTNLTIVVSEPGASCLSACAGRSLGCAPAALEWWFPNSCGALRSFMPHHDWYCHYDANPMLAAVAPAARFHDGYLIVRDQRSVPRNATCSASLPDVERVCTCIHSRAAATAEMLPLTPTDVHRLESSVLWPASSVIDAVEKKSAAESSCPCPSKPYASSEDNEARCLEYLSNFSNVRRLAAMSNNVKFGRTAKFKVQYHDSCVEAILKPPQSSFPLEPFAEYIAFEIDRALRIHLIPPTSWMFLPITAIEEASRSESSFSQWVSQEVLVHVLQNRLTSVDPKSSAVLVGCSVQLFIRGARWQRGTPLNYDDRTLDLLIPSALVQSEQPPRNTRLLAYLSDSMLLDTILANDDRGSQKNSNVFPVGKGQFEPLLLDQGKSLYNQEVRSRYTVRLTDSPTLETRSSADGTPLCLFRKSTKSAILSLEGHARLSERIKRFVPPQIWKAVGQKRLHWMDYRVERLRGHIANCVRLLGEGKSTL